MKRLLHDRKKRWIIIPVAALLLGIVAFSTTLLINEGDKIDDNITNVDTEITPTIKRKVYLLCDQGYVIPVTVSFEEKNSLSEEIYYIFTLMRGGSHLIKDGYKEVLPSSTKISSLVVEDGVLTIDFSNEFATYEKKNEIRIIEALAWTANQYPQITSLKIKIDGKQLTNMPVGNTPLPNNLSKDYGINNHVFTSKIGQARAVSFYQTKIDDKIVYVPVSCNVDNNEVNVSTIAKQLTIRAPFYTNLQVVDELKKTDIISVNIENKVLAIELANNSLIEENYVSQDLYEALVVCFSEVEQIEKVSIIIDGESVSVSGYKNQEDILVSDVYFNEYYI